MPRRQKHCWGSLKIRLDLTEKIHPAAILLCWLMAALAVQFLPLVPLLLVALPAAALLTWLERTGVGQSLRRMRWLLLALWLTMGWSVPGNALFDAAWSPTREGLTEGFQHVLRLLMLVWLIRCVWLLVGREGVLAGLLFLLRPAEWLGLPAERLALRLCLTLLYAEQLLSSSPPKGWGGWRRLMAEAMALPAPDGVQLRVYRWGLPDGVVLAVAATGLGMVMKAVA